MREESLVFPRRCCTLTLTAALLLLGCKSRPWNEGAKNLDFVVSSVAADEPSPVRLARAEGVEYEAHSVTYRMPEWANEFVALPDRKSLDFRFRIRDRATFDRLAERYRFGVGTQVRFPAAVPPEGIVFHLQDFLPPAIQALNGLLWDPFTLSKPSERRAGSNCWGTAYEVVRTAQSGATDFVVSNDWWLGAEKVFRDPNFSREVASLKGLIQGGPAIAEPAGLQPGDLLLVYGNNVLLNVGGRLETEYGLAHVAVYIDNGVYFEKVGDGEGTLFRFLTFSQLLAQRVETDSQFRGGENPSMRPALHWIRPTERAWPRLDKVLRNPLDVAVVPWQEEEVAQFSPFKVVPFALDPTSGLARFPTRGGSFRMRASTDTWLKISEDPPQNLADHSEKCFVKSGREVVVETVFGVWVPGSHVRVALDSPMARHFEGCTMEGVLTNLFLPHWEIVP